MESRTSGIENDHQKYSSFDRNVEEDKRVKTAIKLFVENVSICGLDNAWRANILAERILWCTAFALALTGIVVTSYCTVTRHMEPATVYDDFVVFNDLGPFPNITICSPIAINKSKLLEILVVPSKVKAMAARKNINLNDIIEFTLDYWAFDIKNKAYENRVFANAAHEIMDATAAGYPGGMVGTMKDSTPLCDYIFTDCYFYGQPFKCCDTAQYIFFDGLICYYLGLTRIHELVITTATSRGKMDNIIDEGKSGLLLHVNVDWELASFYDSLANDGYHIFIGPMGTILADPVAIPTGADAIIALSSPYKIKEIDLCHNSENIPTLHFQEYYDQYGVNCIMDTLAMILTKSVGCNLPLFNYIPSENQTQCSSSVLFFMAEAITQGGVDTDEYAKTEMSNVSPETRKLIRHYQEMGNEAARLPQIMSDSCRPLCTRWVYPVMSASYGYIQYQGQSQWEDSKKRNQTWSRIRLFFPEAYYHLRSQKTTSSTYSIIWDTGGVLGVYLGISSVTLIQIISYGLIVCHTAYSGAKRIRIQPLKHRE